MSSSKATTAAVSLNTDKLNYDGSLSFGVLEEVVGGWAFLEKTKTKDILARLPEGCSVVVTKELEMPAETIRSLPKTVKLICEAGTGGSLLLSLSPSLLSQGLARADNLLPTRKATTTSIARRRRRGGSRCVTSRSTPRTPWPRW